MRIRLLLAWLTVVFVSLITPATLQAAGPALVFDAKTGNILYQEDADRLWYPASLTKMMTAYVAFEEIKAGRLSLQDQLTSSRLSVRQAPSKIGLPLGRQMSVDLGLQTLIVKSANDVAVMIAEKISGDVHSFAKRMNATAKKLGMSRTRYYNPNGLPDGRQVTTARDQGLLAQAIIKNFPEHAALFKQIYVNVGKRKLRSHNDLLRHYSGSDGMKTGFVCASGFNIVTSATRKKRRLVAVVLGGTSSATRRVRAIKLLNYGFGIYDWKKLYEPVKLVSSLIDGKDLRGPKNMRYKVSSWSCNGRARPKARKGKKKRKKSKAGQKSKKKKVIKKKTKS